MAVLGKEMSKILLSERALSQTSLREQLIEKIDEYGEINHQFKNWYTEKSGDDTISQAFKGVGRCFASYPDRRLSVYELFFPLAVLVNALKNDDAIDCGSEENKTGILALWTVIAQHYKPCLTEEDLLKLCLDFIPYDDKIRNILRRYEHPADDIHLLLELPDSSRESTFSAVELLFHNANSISRVSALPKPSELRPGMVVVSLAKPQDEAAELHLIELINQRQYHRLLPYISYVQYGTVELSSPVFVLNETLWHQEELIPGDTAQLFPAGIQDILAKGGAELSAIVATSMTSLQNATHHPDILGTMFHSGNCHPGYCAVLFNHNKNLFLICPGGAAILFEKGEDNPIDAIYFRVNYDGNIVLSRILPFQVDAFSLNTVVRKRHDDTLPESTWAAIDKFRHCLTQAMWGNLAADVSLNEQLKQIVYSDLAFLMPHSHVVSPAVPASTSAQATTLPGESPVKIIKTPRFFGEADRVEAEIGLPESFRFT